MADLGGTFDANAKENNKSSAVPAGEYPMVLVDSKKTDAKKGGQFLYCEFQITAGEYQNRRIIHRFNLWITSQEAVDIARGQFSQFCRAVGILSPKDSSELHLKPFIGRVNAKESGEFGIQNNITKFSAKPGLVAPVQTTEAVAQPAGNPW